MSKKHVSLAEVLTNVQSLGVGEKPLLLLSRWGQKENVSKECQCL